jgi:glutamate-1-semialdehyde 2,1-aminomutase
MYEAGFMSMSHTDEDIEKTIEIADEVMSQL